MDNTNNPPRCYTCKWWAGNSLAKDLEKTMGECRRFPPQAAGIVQMQGVAGPRVNIVSGFPTSAAMAGCGEHTPGVVVQ